MKKKFRFLLLPGMVALSFLYYAFQTSLGSPSFTISKIAANASTPTHLKVTNVQGLPQLTNRDSMTRAYWKIFFSLGDGRYWMGALDNLSDQKFFYNPSAKTPAQPFIEYTAAYDDNINPQRTAPVLGLDVTNITTIPVGEERAAVMPAGNVALLECNRELSSDEIVTFMLTRQFPNPIPSAVAGFDLTKALGKFTYDSDVLIFEGFDAFDNIINTSLTPVADNIPNGSNHITKYIEINFKDLVAGNPSPYNQQTIFLNFKVKPNIATASAYVTPKFEVFSKEKGTNSYNMTSPVGQSVLSNQSILNAHDPNHKFGPDTVSVTDQFIYFKIDFQNEGTDSTGNIEVEDKLDLLLDNTFLPEITACPKCTSTVYEPAVLISAQERNYRFKLKNHVALRGLHERGLGKTFTEEDTKGSVTIKCKLAGALAASKSTAILNQAKIRFGCNPLYNTNISKSIIPCSDTIITLADTSMNVVNTHSISGVLNGLTSYLSSYGFVFTNSVIRWYPGTDMDNPYAIAPNFDATAKGTYTLVVSKCAAGTTTSSANKILYVHLNIQNPLSISIDKCVHPGYLVATVNGYTGSNPGSDLQWDLCSKHGLTYEQQILPGKSTYYFGVTDLSTGCYTEIFYKLDRRSICNIPHNWFNENAVYIGLALMFFIAVFMLFRIQKNKFK